MRAAIYTRFSSDLQNPKSCEDQAALCRAFCVRQGHDVVAVFKDRAISGAYAPTARPGNMREVLRWVLPDFQAQDR